MTRELEGKVAVVTGGSRGIGAGIVRSFLREGARAVFTGRRPEGLEEASAALRDEGFEGFLPVAAHSADEAAMSTVFDTAVEKFGAVDIVVNNAATNPTMDRLLDVDLEVFDKIMATNVRAYLLVAREGIRRMANGGVVINVSSLAARQHLQGLGAYGVSKAAVDRLTAGLAQECGSIGVRVVGIAPGLIRTKFSEALWKSPKSESRFSERVPVGRLGDPADIAEVATFLASDRASYITGETILVDGGWHVT